MRGSAVADFENLVKPSAFHRDARVLELLALERTFRQVSDPRGGNMKKDRAFTVLVATGLVLLAVPVGLAAQHTRYKLIDLGTFGGRASYLQNGFDWIQNHRGAVVGWADVAEPDPDPTFCFDIDCFVAHAFQWQDGNLADLGALVPGWSSAALWTNESGQVVGHCREWDDRSADRLSGVSCGALAKGRDHRSGNL